MPPKYDIFDSLGLINLLLLLLLQHLELFQLKYIDTTFHVIHIYFSTT